MSGPTLDDVARAGFSKTARTCPGHREAGRDRHDRPALAVGAWRLADNVAETPTECAQTVEADVEADGRHATAGRAQGEHGALNPPALGVPGWGVAKRRTKRSGEVRIRDV